MSSLSGATAVILCCAGNLLWGFQTSTRTQADSAVARQVSTPGIQLAQLSTSLESVSLKASAAVVQIVAEGSSPNDQENRSISADTSEARIGSGILLSPDGYILTNAHVVAGTGAVRVRLTRRAAAEARQRGDHGLAQALNANIIGLDRGTDLAVLKIAKSQLPYLSFGDSSQLKQGQIILAVGSPFGLDSSVSLGVVSALGRRVKSNEAMSYIQTDAPINPGNSGGPLLNLSGEVVGINTMIMSQSGGSQGVGFAIPSEVAKAVYDQLRTNKRVRRAHLGLVAETVTPQIAETLGLSKDAGAIVSDVDRDGPAEEAGIQSDDIITMVAGKAIERVRQLEVISYQLSPGESVRFHIQRGEKELDVTLLVGEEPPRLDSFDDVDSINDSFVNELGIMGAPVSKLSKRQTADLRRPAGVVVVASNADVEVSGLGLERGDVIDEVNRRVVSNINELKAALHQARDQGMVVLLVEREGHLLYLPVDLK